MSYVRLSSITIINGEATVAVGGSESLSQVFSGDILEVAGRLSEQILSVDAANRVLTLHVNWDQVAVTGVNARTMPSAVDFRSGVLAVAGLSSLATQSVQQWDTLVNKVDTVTITLPNRDTVEISTLPKVLIDATAAGTVLYDAAQTAITLMGDAPALAQQVTDNLAVFDPKYAEWSANSPAFLNNYASVNSSIASFNPKYDDWAANSPTFLDNYVAVNSSITGFNTDYAEWAANSPTFLDNYAGVNSAISDFISVQLPSANQAAADSADSATAADSSAVLAGLYANHPEDDEIPGHPGEFSTAHYMAKTQSLASGTAPNSFQLGGVDAADFFHVANLPTVAQITGLQDKLDSIQEDIEFAELLALGAL